MEAPALCTRLLMSVLLLLVAEGFCDAHEDDVSVILEGLSQPVMEGESITLLCRSNMLPFNHTAEFFKNNMFIRSSDEGTMIIQSVSKSDAGAYRCKISGVGESAETWLYVHDGVVLQGLSQPVMEGQSVTLYCRNNKDPTKRIADFYKHGTRIRTGYDGEMTISRVSKTDEGSYTCSISELGVSAESLLVVLENVSTTEGKADSSPGRGGFHYFVLSSIIVGSLLVVLVVVVGISCFITNRGKSASSTTAVYPDVADPSNVTYSVIMKKERKEGQTRSRCSQEENPQRDIKTVYSTINFKAKTSITGH